MHGLVRPVSEWLLAFASALGLPGWVREVLSPPVPFALRARPGCSSWPERPYAEALRCPGHGWGSEAAPPLPVSGHRNDDCEGRPWPAVTNRALDRAGQTSHAAAGVDMMGAAGKAAMGLESGD